MAKRVTEEQPSWLIANIGLMMYTSLMIIILAFFILLTANSALDEDRHIEVMGAVLGAFGMMPGGNSITDESGNRLSLSGDPTADSMQKDVEVIRGLLSDQAAGGEVHYIKGRDRRVISLESALLFARDGVEIRPEMLPPLREVAAVLKTSDYPVTVEGHTDDRPPQSDKYRDNWQISGLRAANVLRILMGQGVDPKRLSAYGYAGYQPAVANTSPRNRARNNRIDLVLDETYRRAADRIEERYQPKEFDFKGFYFRLFGGPGKKD